MAFAADIPAGSVILDAGAGEQPYRHLFAACQYEAADFEKVDKPYARSTYVCDLAAIPVENDRFDAVIFNQVLEHIPEPSAVLSELRRVLKPGGRMICTAPFFYQEHEQPYDFYRYTQFGWRHLLGKAGFEIERIDWMEGYLGTLAYQLDIARRSLPVRPSRLGGGAAGWTAAACALACRLLFRVAAPVFHRADENFRLTDAGHSKNYVAIVRKPLEAQPA